MENQAIDHLNGNNHENKKKRKKEKKEKKEKKNKNKEVEVEDVTATNGSSNQHEQSSTEKRDKKKQKKAEQNAEATDGNEVMEESKENNENKEKKSKKEKKEKKSKKEKTKSSENSNGHTNGNASNGNHANNGQTKVPAHNSMTSEETEKFRQENNITVAGNDSEGFNPVKSFAEAPFSKDLLTYCKDFKKPTPIQAQCWPVLVAGRDIVAIAETGSGKTIAFSLPVLQHIKNNQESGKFKGKSPVALILSPTRELAMQIAEVTTGSGKPCNINTICLYGGVGKDSQTRQLKQHPQVVVATPGRLLDLLNDGALSLQNISFLVLDEADRMLDLGFERDIRAIIKQIPTQRQTLMFSATWPTSIQNLASEFLNNPVKVTIGSPDLAANHRVNQIVEVMDPYDKERRLEQILKEYHKSRTNKVLIFALYKKEAARLEEVLTRKGWKAQAIHGDKNQYARTDALNAFKDGSIPLLIATDVAARGLDIPDVEYVINYTFPLTIEDYVHRIGRTGRAGKVGTSHTFFTVHDKAHAGALVNVLREANQNVPEELTKFGTHVKKKEHGLYGAHFKEVNTNSKGTHMKFD